MNKGKIIFLSLLTLILLSACSTDPLQELIRAAQREGELIEIGRAHV
jgi:hypothetical protein